MFREEKKERVRCRYLLQNKSVAAKAQRQARELLARG
jgi:hypothetical protein